MRGWITEFLALVPTATNDGTRGVDDDGPHWHIPMGQTLARQLQRQLHMRSILFAGYHLPSLPRRSGLAPMGAGVQPD